MNEYLDDFQRGRCLLPWVPSLVIDKHESARLGHGCV